MFSRAYTRLFVIAIIFAGASFYYLPFYISKPGLATELAPIIEVENGYEEDGSFMLTTVRMGRANIYSYSLAKLSNYQRIYRLEDIRGKDETDEEYNVRQLYSMTSSKLNAIEVAYKKAGLPVSFEYNGVYVLDVFPGMPADGKLMPGDRITKVDNHTILSSEDFIQFIQNKHAGDKVTLEFVHEGDKLRKTVEIAYFDDKSDKVGLGIGLVDDKEIVVDPDVEILTDKIGGPSAGLMFTLEIYNQLMKDDLTKGFEIAGTGTIDQNGNVGRIGGIEQKIIAADKVKADIFFAPNENGAKDSNYNIALKTAKDINSNMKVIPVDTFEDALEYLHGLNKEESR